MVENWKSCLVWEEDVRFGGTWGGKADVGGWGAILGVGGNYYSLLWGYHDGEGADILQYWGGGKESGSM